MPGGAGLASGRSHRLCDGPPASLNITGRRAGAEFSRSSELVRAAAGRPVV
jgi:hypothetical protein